MTLLSINPQLLISMPGASEWIFILLAVVILFGGKKIPELAKGLGKGMREFKNAKEGLDQEHDTEVKTAQDTKAKKLENIA